MGFMADGCLRMSKRELTRLEVVQRVQRRRLTQREAAALLGLSVRQVERLCRAYREDGVAGLVSKRRGAPSNNHLKADLRTSAMALVHAEYSDFGPTLAQEQLQQRHGIEVSRDSLRKWMIAENVWVARAQRQRVFQRRNRRACIGELVQIDGCDYEWFEDRAPRCTALVYVDDATGALMEVRFVESESAFSYFEATCSYLERHGKPVAFYSDRASVFRVAEKRGKTYKTGTQFARAMSELNIDIICANSPQARGRVERAHQMLQDRLVKEFRLEGISSREAANAFMAGFMAKMNTKFARAPKSPHDAHRALLSTDNPDRTLTWQEDRKLSRNLSVHFKNKLYLVEPSPNHMRLAKKKCRVHEWGDGRVEIWCDGQRLPCEEFDKNPRISNAAIVDNKRLGAVLAHVRNEQDKRDALELKSKKRTLRQKARLLEVMEK